MKLLGHYEAVPIRNSNRKVEVYFPHFISKVFPLIPINGWPFLILWSTGERIADLALWVIIVETLLCAILDLFYISYRVISDGELKRMRNGELVSKSGELYEIGKWGSPDHGGRPFYRFAIKGSNENGEPFDEIYEMPPELYDKYLERFSHSKFQRASHGPAYLVEIVYLPPLNTPEFTYLEPSSKLRKPNDSHIHLPISKSQVVEIFYNRKLSYKCYIGSGALFARW